MADSKTKKSKVKYIFISFFLIMIIFFVTATGMALNFKKMITIEFTKELTIIETDKDERKTKKKNKTPSNVKRNKEVYRDQQDLDGSREAKAKVDVGFDTPYAEREYWAYTNKKSQLVYVHADEIILQNDAAEAEWMEGGNRYSPDVAGVPGSEYTGYDKGHVIADSLGGNSTAYNVTPQNWYLNEKGSVYQLEDDIRDAGGAKNFSTRIYYRNNDPYVPVKYYITFEIEGDYGMRLFYEYTLSNEHEGLVG